MFTNVNNKVNPEPSLKYGHQLGSLSGKSKNIQIYQSTKLRPSERKPTGLRHFKLRHFLLLYLHST